MKIRIMGTEAECKAMAQFFSENLSGQEGYSVSGLYRNRGNTNMWRVYIELAAIPSSIGVKRLQGNAEQK